MNRFVFLFTLLNFASPLLAVNSFTKAGAPSPTREWYGADYIAIAELVAAKKIPLPRFTDPDGSEFLNRLCDIQNFSLCKNLTLPLNQRLESYLQLQDGTNRLLKIYWAEQSKGIDYRRELSAICSFTLHTAALGVDMTEEFLPTVPKDDKYEIRMEGLRGMKNGLALTFVGIEAALSEGIFDPEGILLVEKAMAETLPRLKTYFSPDFSAELTIKLKKRLEASKDSSEIKYLNQMLKELTPN